MGKISEILPVKLICGFISKYEEYSLKVKSVLENEYGKIDFISEALPFTYTNYYEKEIGTDLLRQFISFENLIMPDTLSKIKIHTNNIESRFLLKESDKRQINIDPGYITLAKLILATTKDRAHRIYIGEGIYAEITLHYFKKTFQPFDWTYPDYRIPEYINIFNQIRIIYYKQFCTLFKI